MTTLLGVTMKRFCYAIIETKTNFKPFSISGPPGQTSPLKPIRTGIQVHMRVKGCGPSPPMPGPSSESSPWKLKKKLPKRADYDGSMDALQCMLELPHGRSYLPRRRSWIIHTRRLHYKEWSVLICFRIRRKKAFVCFPEYTHGDNVKRVSVPRTDAAVRGA